MKFPGILISSPENKLITIKGSKNDKSHLAGTLRKSIEIKEKKSSDDF